jgi:ABC-2 type transport system ATP-binding protein
LPGTELSGDAVVAPSASAPVQLAQPTAAELPGGANRPAPNAPVPDNPALLTLAAAIRREVLANIPHVPTTSTPPGATAALPEHDAADALNSGPSSGTVTARTAVAKTSAPSTSTSPSTPTPVVAIPQTAPLQNLQYIPVIGRAIITPLVAAINRIPLVGPLLHPLLGYPVQYGLAPGTPVPRDVKVVSFDGTQIYVHFLPATGLAAGEKAPVILDGPGLGIPGSTDYLSTTDPLFGKAVVGIGALRNAGYSVVTWDPRGEFFSGGTAEIDSPDFEAKDVSAIISWVATQPEVQLDGPAENLDPRMGMVGLSYGGGIQLVGAATDHRIDAIVPTMAWNSLNTSLYKNDAFKSGWGTVLSLALALTGARPNPLLYPAAIYGDLTGNLTEAHQQLLADRGPGDLISKITAPTLLVQGTVDTLFTLQEADANAKILLANGVPTKVVWFCGGHGTCVSSTNDGSLIIDNTLNWLARYVKNDTTVDTGPQFEWVDQHGATYSSDTYPVHAGSPLVTTSSTKGTLPLIPLLGGSGPQQAVFSLGPLGAILGLPSAAKAANAFNVTTAPTAATTYLVGAPKLTFTYTGVGTGDHVYAQLVDNRTGLVLGNLSTPVAVTLDGTQRQASVDMEEVAHTLAPGDTLTLQIVSSTANYQTINSIGALTISGVTLSLPTADPRYVTVNAATGRAERIPATTQKV